MTIANALTISLIRAGLARRAYHQGNLQTLETNAAALSLTAAQLRASTYVERRSLPPLD